MVLLRKITIMVFTIKQLKSYSNGKAALTSPLLSFSRRRINISLKRW